MTVRALILTAPGINCDRETLEAARLAGAGSERVHVNQLLSGERRLAEYGLLVLPGGFSHGDHLGAGAVLATVLRAHLLGDLLRFVEAGRPVLGICNGFQVLSRLGLLGAVSLAPNEPEGFVCRWVRLRADGAASLFLDGLEELELPIAHGQGRVVVSGQIRAPLRYLDNPNGSTGGIAGVCNAMGNVFGLMPHPERYVVRHHHPVWQRGSNLPPLGLTIFQNAVRYATGL